MTSYFYHAAQDLNAAPSQWLCSDQSPQHNSGANVLLTDGAIKRIPAAEWFGMGFKTAQKLMEEWAPKEQPGPLGGWGGLGKRGAGGGDE
jgi:hypothetical protein